MSSTAPKDFDETLKSIAKALFKRTDIDNLGGALGFGVADIGRYVEENARQSGSYMGTLDMLRTWQNRQTAAKELDALRAALLKAQLDHLADEHLSCVKPSDSKKPTSSSTSNSNTGCGSERGRIATTKELNNVASLLHADFYTDLAVNLGLEPAEFDNIKRENPALKDATFRMLLKWKARENGGSVVDLDKALKDSGSRALSKQYKDN